MYNLYVMWYGYALLFQLWINKRIGQGWFCYAKLGEDYVGLAICENRCLMRIGHALNVLAQYSESLIEVVKEKGIRGFIDFVRETIIVLLLESQFVNKRLSEPIQLRLI